VALHKYKATLQQAGLALGRQGPAEYGDPGRLIVAYDNETGKGGHRHLDDDESPHAFVSVEALVADFLADVRQRRPK
jgi:hypothetical protein